MATSRTDATDATDTGDAPRPGDGTASERLRDVAAATVISRRGVLWRTGLATVAGAAALSALDERRADAATGGTFLLGDSNTATSPTELGGTGNPIMQLDGTSLGATATTLVINAPTGGNGLYVAGSSTTSTTGLAINGAGAGTANGVLGTSGSGVGVSGNSSTGTGVAGNCSAGTAVNGTSSTGTGVSGVSTGGPGVAGTSGTGYGVRGTSTSSVGVIGTSPTSTGVAGTSTSGSGVSGTSTSGTGVHASSTTGNALSVNGKAHFSRSGSSSIPAHHTTKTVTVSGITSASLVLVTLQSAVSGLYVQSAVPASGKFTVHLSKKAHHTTKFAWFVLN